MGLPSKSVTLICVNTVFTTLAAIAVVLRFYAIRVIGRKHYLSDYLIVFALFFTIGTTIAGILTATIGGAGHHSYELSAETLVIQLKLFIVGPVVWTFATTFLKLSILSFYHKIFGSKKPMRIAIYIESAIVLALFLASFLEPFVLCRPLKYTWDRNATGTCGNFMKAYMAVAVTNFLVDVSIYILPMPVLWSLQMDKKKKFGLCGIFAFGFIVCIFSGLRIYALLMLSVNDYSYTVVRDVTFGGLEIQLGTINACLPFYRPLMNKYIPWFRTERRPAENTWKSTVRPNQPPNTREGGSQGSQGSQKPLNSLDVDVESESANCQSEVGDIGNTQQDGNFVEKGLPTERIPVDRPSDAFYLPGHRAAS